MKGYDYNSYNLMKFIRFWRTVMGSINKKIDCLQRPWHFALLRLTSSMD